MHHPDLFNDCKYIPDPTATNIPVFCKIISEKLFPMPLSAFGHCLDDLWPCSEMFCGTLHLLDPRYHPTPSSERCEGQMVNSDMLCGRVNIDERARIISTSLFTSQIPSEELCRAISLLHANKGIILVDFFLSFQSKVHVPPTKGPNVQHPSDIINRTKALTIENNKALLHFGKAPTTTNWYAFVNF